MSEKTGFKCETLQSVLEGEQVVGALLKVMPRENVSVRLSRHASCGSPYSVSVYGDEAWDFENRIAARMEPVEKDCF